MKYIGAVGLEEVRSAANTDADNVVIDPMILRALLYDFDAMKTALERIATTTGRNGHTATNIIELAKSVIQAQPPKR